MDTIQASTSPAELISILKKYGCDDVTHALDPNQLAEVPIASGGYSDVYQGMLLGGAKVALKTRRSYVHSDEENLRQLKRSAVDMYGWSKLKHPNIQELYGAAVFRGHFAAVSLWMKNGTLPEYIARSPEVDRMKLCVQVSAGLEYMHEHGLIHCNLKGSSILVDEAGAPKISGFGHLKLRSLPLELMPRGEEEEGEDVLSIRWTAPELLTQGGPSTPKTDMYALGMVLFEITTGRIPFADKKDMSVMFAIAIEKKTLEIGPKEIKVSDEDGANMVRELMNCCWSHEPEIRPEASEIVQKLQIALAQRPQSSIVISRKTLGSEIISHLIAKGVANMTSRLDLDKCETHPIAGGGFGDIYHGQLLRGRKVAIKCPRLFYRQDALAGETARNIAREVYTWSKLHHPNILELIGLATFQGQLSIVAPWQENGTLTSYLKKNPQEDGFQLCVQVSSGLAYLHASNTVHGDIKGDNILVSKEGVAKLTDFGNTLLKKYTMEFTGKGDTSPFSMRWSAPELLEGSTQTKEADVYALGMTFLQIVTGDVPFRDRPTDVAVMRAIVAGRTPKRPENLNKMEKAKGDTLWEITSKCWSFEVAERPNASEVERELSRIELNISLNVFG